MQLVDHAERGVFGDAKFTARFGMNGLHHKGDALFFQRLADSALGAETVIAGELILLRPQHFKREAGFAHTGR